MSNHPTASKRWRALGIALAALATVGAAFAYFRRPAVVEAVVTCQPNSILQTQLGKINLRQYDLGELVVRSRDGEWRRIMALPIAASAVRHSRRVDGTRTNVSAGYEVKVSGEVSQQLKAEIEEEIKALVAMSILNYTRSVVDQNYLLRRLNSPEVQGQLRAVQVPLSEADQPLYVVSEVVLADSLESTYERAQELSAGASSTELMVSGVSIRLKNRCFGSMAMNAKQAPLLFEFTPALWNPTRRLVVFEPVHP